ncbi:MAG: hypothetical protein QNJ94_00945 [Alphaproteobacteria bacterium]|nr:hypothetical protein [Alphaproteobacteria bacterium]
MQINAARWAEQPLGDALPVLGIRLRLAACEFIGTQLEHVDVVGDLNPGDYVLIDHQNGARLVLGQCTQIAVDFGICGKISLEPDCCRVLSGFLGIGVDLREAIVPCWLYAAGAPEIDASVKPAIDSSLRPRGVHDPRLGPLVRARSLARSGVPDTVTADPGQRGCAP